MPDRGLLLPASVGDATFDTEATLTLASARWLQVTFEVERSAALALMPEEVGRPIPPYGRVLVAESPSGNLAVLSVGGRYRMMPRNVVVAVVASAGLERAARGLFGQGVTLGSVELNRSGADVIASVADAAGLLASAALPSVYAIEPTMLRWDALVAVARRDGVAVIAEVTPAPEITAAFLSKGAAVQTSPSLPAESVWRRLQSLGTVSACLAEGALVFGAPQVAQTWGQ